MVGKRNTALSKVTSNLLIVQMLGKQNRILQNITPEAMFTATRLFHIPSYILKKLEEEQRTNV